MGVSCIQVYYSKVIWVLWVLRETQCTFSAANQNTVVLGASAPFVMGDHWKPGGKSLLMYCLPCIHPPGILSLPMSIHSPCSRGQLNLASSAGIEGHGAPPQLLTRVQTPETVLYRLERSVQLAPATLLQ